MLYYMSNERQKVESLRGLAAENVGEVANDSDLRSFRRGLPPAVLPRHCGLLPLRHDDAVAILVNKRVSKPLHLPFCDERVRTHPYWTGQVRRTAICRLQHGKSQKGSALRRSRNKNKTSLSPFETDIRRPLFTLHEQDSTSAFHW